MKRLLTVAAVTASLVLTAAPAIAAPTDPCVRDATECREQSGPGLSSDRDYFCTYQWQFGGEVCRSAPGRGQPQVYFVERAPSVWWNPLTW